jgi:hypothetical protein
MFPRPYQVWDLRTVSERAHFGLGSLSASATAASAARSGPAVHGVALDRSACVCAAACDDGAIRVLDIQQQQQQTGSSVGSPTGKAASAASGAAAKAPIAVLRGHTDAAQVRDPRNIYPRIER